MTVLGQDLRILKPRSALGPGVLDVLDLAGGSGFPSIPLAREFPDARITLTGAQCGS